MSIIRPTNKKRNGEILEHYKKANEYLIKLSDSFEVCSNKNTKELSVYDLLEWTKDQINGFEELKNAK